MEYFYDRTKRLLGESGIMHLQALHVIVLGIGGVGSWACEALARTGVGTMTLVDFDRIEPSNLNRQVHALQSTIGRYKVDVMAERLRDINPDIVVHTHCEKIIADALPDYLSAGDFTIDCMDDVRAKVALMRWHLAHEKRIVSSMGTGNKLGTAPFKIVDISKTKVCPLARAVRKKLREAGIFSGVPVLYSEEEPYTQPPAGEKPGTLCFPPAMAGLLLAQYVLLQLLDL